MSPTKWNATRLGVLFSLLMMANSLFCYYVLHWPYRGNTMVINYSIFVVGLILTIVRFGLQSSSSHLGQYFSEGFKAFIVVTFLMVLFSYIFIKTQPDALQLDEFIKENSIQISNSNSKQAQEIAANEAEIRSHITTITIAWMTISHLLLGTLFSFVTGGIMSSLKLKPKTGIKEED